MSKWTTICDDIYEGCRFRTRGMNVPGGMLIQTIAYDVYKQTYDQQLVFIPDGKGISEKQSVWLETQRENPTGNTH